MTPARPPRLALALALVAIVAGCGFTSLQTARTTPRGETCTTVAAGIIHNDASPIPDSPISGVPIDVMVRHGATDRVDWGVRLFFGFGALGDVKWNLLDPSRRTALAISAGLGAAVTDSGTLDGRAEVFQVPVTVTASRTFLSWLTPYAAVGYGATWIFGYGTPMPGVQYAARTWTGDGLLSLHAGVELSRASGRSLLLEYAYARPVVDDPGDFYKFATSQLFSIGFHTGRGSEPFLSR